MHHSLAWKNTFQNYLTENKQKPQQKKTDVLGVVIHYYKHYYLFEKTKKSCGE